MSSSSVNITAISVSVLVALTYFAGVMSDANAFFFALTIVTVFTGYHLTRYEGRPAFEVLRSLFSNPSAFPRRRAYYSFVGCFALGTFVLVEAIAFGL